MVRGDARAATVVIEFLGTGGGKGGNAGLIAGMEMVRPKWGCWVPLKCRRFPNGLAPCSEMGASHDGALPSQMWEDSEILPPRAEERGAIEGRGVPDPDHSTCEYLHKNCP
jgi:hypothetical protein